MIRAITFDLFDTLVDLHFDRLPVVQIGGKSLPSTLGVQHEVLVGRGHAIDLESYAAAVQSSDRELGESHFRHHMEVPTPLRFERIAARLGLDDAGLPEALTRVHMGGISAVAETPAHHVDVLASLAPHYRLGLCSNFSHAETALAVLREADLVRFFTAFVVSETARFRKPRGEIFAQLLDEISVPASEAVHVGDRLSDDVEGASKVGMRTIWITRRVNDPDGALAEHHGAKPTWIIRDLGEIAALVAGA